MIQSTTSQQKGIIQMDGLIPRFQGVCVCVCACVCVMRVVHVAYIVSHISSLQANFKFHTKTFSS